MVILSSMTIPLGEEEKPVPEPTNEQMQRGEPTPKHPGKQVSRAEELRRRVGAETDEDSMLGLEQVFEAKLAAVKVYEQQLASVTDPYAKKTLQRLIRQERQELLGLTELIELVERSPELGPVARARLKLNHQVKAATGRDSGFWLGALVVGTLLLPGVREKVRPLAVKTAQGVMDLSEQVKSLLGGMREDLEDLVSEAQFEKFKKSIDAEITAETLLDDQPPSDGK